MIGSKGGRLQKALAGLTLLVIVTGFCGCRTIGFYSQALKGQLQLFTHAKSIDNLIANTNTPARLRERLELMAGMRNFAKETLHLPVDGHYRKYVDVHRAYVVWNVEAAPEFSLQPRAWWYPLVGSLEYRGYFSEKGARKYGAKLEKQGSDVFIGGVEAYSTLGWFKDPLLNTFIFEPEPDVAEIMFHELGHQRVFARGDTDFNEAFATTVGQEGARRWLSSKGSQKAHDGYVAELGRTIDFVHLIAGTREKLERLYGDEITEDGKVKATNKNKGVPPEELREKKKRIIEAMREEYRSLKAKWGSKEYDGWFAREVNNAQLNSVAAYYDLVPGFERLLQINGNDLERFYSEAERLSKMNKKARHQWLMTLGAATSDEITNIQPPSSRKAPNLN